MYYVAETQVRGREAIIVSPRHSADLQMTELSHVKMGRVVENFRRLSAKKAAVDGECQAPGREIETAALVLARGVVTPEGAPSYERKALPTDAGTDPSKTDPNEIGHDRPALEGEILGNEVPDPEARVVTADWATFSRDLTPKRRAAKRARSVSELPPAARRAAAAANAMLLSRDATAPGGTPSSESKEPTVDAEIDLTDTDQDRESAEAELVLAKAATMPEGVASPKSKEPTVDTEIDPTDTDQDRESADAELVLAKAAAMPEGVASPKKKVSSADANQADAKTDKRAARKGVNALSRGGAAILARALKTAKSQSVADHTDLEPDSADPVAAAETAQPDNDRGRDDELGMVEIHPSLPKVNPSLVFGATMALWSAPRFTSKELLDMIAVILEGTGAVASLDQQLKPVGEQQMLSRLKRRLGGPPNASLRVNGLLTLVGGGDKPAFVGKALKERVNPALWSEGVQRLSQSRGHVMIADAQPNDPNDPDLNYDRAVAVTVTAMAVSLLTDPVGIIWHPAGNATPPDVIPDFIQSLSHNLAPLPLWLRWLLVPSTDGRNPGAASRGLLALLGMELEMAPNDFSLEKTVNDLFQIAAVHVRSGKVPPDGMQVRSKDKTWYVVRHHKLGSVTKTPVFRLTPVSDYSGN